MKKKRVQVEVPIRHIEGSLVFGTDGWVWKYFEVEPYDYTYRPNREKDGIKKLWTSLFTYIQETGVRQVHILGLPEYAAVEQQHEQLMQAMRGGPLARPASNYLKQAAEAVKESLKGPSGYRTFIGFRLQRVSRRAIKRNLRRKIYHKAMDWRRYIGTISGLEPFDILEEELLEYQEQGEDLYQDFRHYIPLRPVTTMDLQWAIRLITGLGATSTPSLRPDWKPQTQEKTVHDQKVIRPNPPNVWSLNNSLFDADDYEMQVKQIDDRTGEEKEGIMSFLHCFQMPDSMDHIGQREWGYWMQELPYDYPYSVRMEVVPNDEAEELVRKQKIALQNAREETRTEGQQIDAHLEEKYQDAIDKEGQLHAGEYPILNVSVIFGISAPTREELNYRKTQLKSRYRRRKMELNESPGTPFLSMNEFMPGGRRYVEDFIHQLEPPMVGGAAFGATSELGDKTGFFVGKTGPLGVDRSQLNKPVLIFPAMAAQTGGKANSISMLFVGKVGFGKSQSMNQVFYQTILASNALGIIIDPKGERGNWVNDLPILKDHMNLISLGSDDKEDRGVLDPFQIFSPQQAATIAHEFLASVLDLSRKDDWYGMIHEAVVDVSKYQSLQDRHMRKVLLQLKNQDQRLYKRLSNYEESMFAHLVFSEGTQERTLSFDDPLNVLQINGLQIPPRDKNPRDYGEIEALSVAIMGPLMGYIRQQMRKHPGRVKLQGWDEAWMPLASSQGQTSLDSSIREGRKLNAGAVLSTQNPLDIPDYLWNNIGMRFVFNLDSDEQITKALEMLRMEDSQANREAIQNLKAGECFFRDIQGRVGRLYFDPLFANLMDAFNTTPKDEIIQQMMHSEVAQR